MVTLQITEADLNVILQHLGQGKYVEVAGVIAKIASQAAPKSMVKTQMGKKEKGSGS